MKPWSNEWMLQHIDSLRMDHLATCDYCEQGSDCFLKLARAVAAAAMEEAAATCESVKDADWVKTPRTKGGSTFMEPAARELLLEAAAAIRARAQEIRDGKS